MKQYAVLYIATLVVMTILDLAWLGGVAKDFYKNRLGDLMEIRLLPAILFYLMYVAGVLIFASAEQAQWQQAMLRGALFGFFAYATYDMTNLATLKGWPLSITIADIAWGTFVTAIASGAGRFLTNYFLRA